MNSFKKLQQNSMYWRYRFITRRWLALKRWTRSWRQPSLRQVRHRGNTLWVPDSRVATWRGRGVAFVLTTAVVLTALQLVVGSRIVGLGMTLLELALVAALVYAFTRTPPARP
jgi:hypothetical protein